MTATRQDVLNDCIYKSLEPALFQILRSSRAKHPKLSLTEFAKMLHEGFKEMIMPMMFDEIPTADFRRRAPEACHYAIDRFVKKLIAEGN